MPSGWEEFILLPYAGMRTGVEEHVPSTMAEFATLDVELRRAEFLRFCRNLGGRHEDEFGVWANEFLVEQRARHAVTFHFSAGGSFHRLSHSFRFYGAPKSHLTPTYTRKSGPPRLASRMLLPIAAWTLRLSRSFCLTPMFAARRFGSPGASRLTK